MKAIILSQNLLKYIARLSSDEQTSAIEAFHSLLIQFPPKNYEFGYTGMKCHSMLAALHYNENCGRRQAKNLQGRPLFKIVFPKYKKGGYIVRKVLSKPTYKYIDRLMCSVIEGCQQPLAQRAQTSGLQKAEEPPSLSSV